MNSLSAVALRKTFLAITIQTISAIDREHHMQLHGQHSNSMWSFGDDCVE